MPKKTRHWVRFVWKKCPVSIMSLGVIQKLRGQEELFRWSVESLQMVGIMQNVQNCPLEVGRWSKLGKIWST